MDPIQAINTLSQVVKSAKLPYNDHVLLERCVDVLGKEIQSKTGDGSGSTDVSNVTFDEAEVVEPQAKAKPRARARAKKGAK